MMFRTKFTFVLSLLTFAQDTLCKSIQKHTKKDSITKENSHYLLLMGSPVEDGHHHKGLGMIFASEHSRDLNTSKEAESGHSEVSSNGDLVSTLQKSSNGSLSDRGYSYTEALFTGTPLLNGRPFTASDRTPYSQGHVTDPHIGGFNANDTVTGNSKGEAVDKGNDGNGIENNGQTHEEVHTDEGVTRITANKKGRYTGEKSEEKSQDTNSFRPSSEQQTEHFEHGYPVPPHSVNESQDKSQENKQAHRGRKVVNNKIEGDHLAVDVHEIMATGHTQENFDNENKGSSGQRTEELKVNNEIPFSTKIKSYDEESNLLGSNTLNHGRLINQQRVNPLREKQERYNQNTISFHLTDNERAQGLKQRQEDLEQQQNMITITEDSRNTQKVQKDNSPGKTSLDAALYALGSNLKERNPVSTGETSGIQDSRGSATLLPPNESEDGRGNHFYNASGQMKGKQHRQETLEVNFKTSTDSLGKIQTGKLNDSMTSSPEKAKTSSSDYRFQNFISQLRPHKIIESAFDEELVQRIPTGPSYHQDSHERLTKQPNEKLSSSLSFPGVDSSHLSTTYREGSNPSVFQIQNQELTKEIPSVPESSSNAATATVSLTSNNLEGSTVQQDNANQLSTSAASTRLSRENALLVSNASPNPEQGNVNIIEGHADHTSKPYRGADDNSTESQRYSSDQGQAFLNIPSSHRQGSNPADFSTTNNLQAEGHGKDLGSSTSVGPGLGQLGALSGNEKEEAMQEGNSHPFSNYGIAHNSIKVSYNGHQLVKNLQNNAKYSSQENQGSPTELAGDKTQREPSEEIQPTLYHGKGSGASEHRVQESEITSGRIEMETDANSKSSYDLMPSYGVGTRLKNGETSSQQVTQNSAKEEGANDAANFYSLRPKPSGPHGFEVGFPEHPGEVSVEDKPKPGSNDQQQPESNIDRDNNNQKIVYFLKMAKGIPLLNNRPENDQDEKHKQSNSEAIKESDRADTAGGIASHWGWQPRLGPGYRQPSKTRSYSSSGPIPSLNPNPTAGGREGAIDGSSVTSNDPQDDEDFEQEALESHNNYRKTHGVPEMTLDRDLCNQAKAYAQKIANVGQLIHSSQEERGNSVGENLAYACSSNGIPLTGKNATKMWYDEVCKPGYDFSNGSFSSSTGHFTQVVWKDSVNLGIGQGKAMQNGMQCIYAVGRYKIAGNIPGEFQDEVFRGNFNDAYCNNV